MNEAAENTDHELWRERDGDYYANSIHVTKQGNIGISVGGYVVVKSLTEWHTLQSDKERMREALDTCAKVFRRYGELHRMKGTAEGNLKASNNDDLAEFCEGVIGLTTTDEVTGRE